WDLQPSQSTLDELASVRHATTEGILDWLLPAIEYRVDWLQRPLSQIADWFAQLTRTDSGYSLPREFHQSWTSLTLKACVAAAIAYESWGALSHLLALPAPIERSGDTSPLLISPGFTWADGYGGDSRVAFDDFVVYATQSGVTAELLRPGQEPAHLVCVADLVLGLARCSWDARMFPDDAGGH